MLTTFARFESIVFKTPLPNQKLWNGATIGLLSSQDVLANGGWWHDSRILAATGEGLAKEESRAWEGWWNEIIVQLVELSIKQNDTLCVLLTGRSESGFGELVKRIVASRGLDFHMVSLKPSVGPNGERFDSTMHFKQIFLRRLMETYSEAEEIRIYEDRPKHVKGFREFLADYNKRLQGPNAVRSPLLTEVIQVADISTSLNPVIEVAEIQHMINEHNAAVTKQTDGFRGQKLMIKKTVFFTGYMIPPEDTKRLLTLATIPPGIPDTELKYHGNNIMICPRPCPPSLLEKVGGMNAKMRWAVTGVACHENNIWAACLRPIPDNARFHTDNPSPLVVLALRKGAKPIDAAKIKNWQPVPPEKAFEFETTVGEKVLLRIESEDPNENAYESLFPHKGTAKRKHPGSDNNNSPGGRFSDRPDRGGFHGPRGGQYRGRGNFNNNNFRGGGGHRGGDRRGNRGGARGQMRGGRGRGGGGRHYQSLDDVGTRDFGGSTTSAMYDDNPSTGQWGSSFNSTRSNAGPSGGNGNNSGGVEQYY